MKKLFVSLLAIAGMVACTNDEVVSVQQGNPIAFDTFVENTTRVGYDSNNLTGFDVWAFMDNVEGVVLTDENVTGGKGSFSYVNTQYWVPGHTYYFAALAPMDSANVVETLATGDDALKGLGTLVFTNENDPDNPNDSGTEDLIYAVKMVEANENTNKVTFTFDHLLSKVKFSFTNTFDNANYSIKVYDIKMTAPKTGTIDLTAGEYVWKYLAGETTLVYGVAHVVGDETNDIAAMGKTVSPTDERLTIPAGEGQVYGVTFKVDLYVGNGANKVLAKTYEKGSTISGIEFEAGKAYNFAAAINAESLALSEVIFDASVNGWDDAATVQLIDTAAELRDAFDNENVNHIILDGNIDLSDLLSTLSTRAGEPTYGLLIPAGRTLTLDLNGCTISQSKAQTGSYAMIDNKGTLIIEDNSSSKNGKISFKDTGAGDPTYGWGSYTICNNGNLIVNGGTIENLSEQAAHMYCAIFQYSGSSTINGGKISTPNYRSARLWHGDMTIKGGQFEGQLWLQAVADNTSNLTIEGGSFAPRGGDFSSVFVENDTYNVAFAVTGGHFETKIGMSKPFGCITGGTFTTEAKEGTNVNILAKGYAFIEGENGDYTVVNTGHYTDENGNYYISNANGLAWVSENVNTMEFYVNQSANIFDGKTVYLTNDIDLGGAEWRPIGDYAFSRTSFNGVFDGQGYTVSNFKVTDPVQWTQKVTEASYGFFGNVKGTIKNLTIKNATINPDGGRFCGALVGRLHDGGRIENCHVVNSSATINHWQVGGLVGQNNNGNISNCSVDESTITGMAAVGAIVGMDMANGEHTIENCRVTNTTLVQNDSFGASYDASYGLAVGLVNASGIILNIDNFVAENNTIKGNVANTIVGDIKPGAKVTINGTQIVTTAEQLTSALKDVNANSIILGADITVTEKWDNRYTGAKTTRPITIDGNGKTLKFACEVSDGFNYQAAFRFEAPAVVKNLTIDMSEVTGTGSWLRAISTKGDITVDNCTFIGSTNYTSGRGIAYGESAGAAAGDIVVSVTNSTFRNWTRRGLTDNENGQDAKDVTVVGNTFSNAHCYVSAHDSIVVTGNTMNNSCVNIKTYTKATDATVVATGNTLDANLSDYNNISGFVAANVTCQEGFNIY